MNDASFLKQLAIATIAIAKQYYSDEQFQQLAIPHLQKSLQLMSECVPREHTIDPLLLHHVADCLIHHYSVEETVMHSFLLYIYRLSVTGSQHPLERGIIKQKINSLLPIFETGVNQGLIRAEVYDKNADALVAIADGSTDMFDILAALGEEYRRLSAH